MPDPTDARAPSPADTARHGLRFADRACYLTDEHVLVLADLHVGKDAASDVAFPLGEGDDLADRFASLLDRFDPATAVLAGDVLHSFSTVPQAAADTLERLRTTAHDRDTDVVAIRGNHDALLDGCWPDPVNDEFHAGDTVVCHGHVEPATRADRYVVGHDHPVIRIEGARHPCALLGTYHDADVVVLPAFTRLASGCVVNRQRTTDFQSPLVTDADGLRPVVRDDDADETHTFPPLGSFRELL